MGMCKTLLNWNTINTVFKCFWKTMPFACWNKNRDPNVWCESSSNFLHCPISCHWQEGMWEKNLIKFWVQFELFTREYYHKTVTREVHLRKAISGIRKGIKWNKTPFFAIITEPNSNKMKFFWAIGWSPKQIYQQMVKNFT